MSDDVNIQQRAHWNEAAGRSWAELQALMDRQLEPLGAAVIAALDPRPGDRVLDVGCGNGATTLALAAAVGPSSRVVGADVSEPMLKVARARPTPPGASPIDWRVADVQTHAFPADGFDIVFSRFGVMFFDDPAAAFANLHRALRPGGQIGFVCWRATADNPMFTAPMAVAVKHLPAPAPPPPGAPGPFAFAEPGRATGLLSAAGFTDARAAPLDLEISPGPIEDAVTLALRIGPVSGLLQEHPDKAEAVANSMRESLTTFVRDGAVRYPSATWLVTATKS